MTKMNLKRLSLLLLLVLPLRMIMAAEDLPKPYNFARYQGMTDRSPFAVATSLAPAETPNFAKDLYVANAAHNGKEGDLVTIASSTDRNFKKYLATGAPVDGFGIANIEWSEKVGATKVTITKDGQSATLIFNEALLKQPAAGGQNVPAPPVPQKQPELNAAAQPAAAMAPTAQQNANATKPMPVPQLPTPPPRVRGVIPRNPAATGGKTQPKS
jgi:hypothetical protein